MATFSTATQTTADLEANASLAKALSPYVSANRALINTAASEQARNWRAAANATSTFNNAINTGSASAYMRALVDLATAPLERTPASTDLLGKVSAITQQQQNLNKSPTNPDVATQLWQTLSGYDPGGAQAYGNVQELKRITGIQDDAAILALLKERNVDPVAYKSVEQTLNQAQIQTDAIDHQRALQGNLAYTQAQDLIAQHPRGVPEDVAQAWRDKNKGPLLEARTAVGMGALTKIVEQEANRPVELTGTAKDEYEFNQAMQKQLLAQTTTESDRDRAAKLINSPMFREWAQSNGFDIGHIEQPDPNKEYAPGELTTSGLYVPGRDDYKAVMLAQRQLSMDPNKWHPFMPKGAGIKGELKKYGALDVQLAPPSAAPAPAAAPEPPPAQELTDAAGWKYRLYNGEMSVIGGPAGSTTKATPENPLKLPSETARKALQEIFAANGFSAEEALTETEASLADSRAPAALPPTESATEPASEKVYGAIGRNFAGDPVGSRRLNGDLYLKDESTGKFYRAAQSETGVAGETITSAQGPNALKAFAEEVRARRASNVARRLEDKEDGAKAPLRAAAIGLAQTLTPERQTEAEKARAVEYNRQQEMERRAQNQALEDTAPRVTSRNIPSVTPAGIGMAPVEGALQAPGPSTSLLSAAQAEPLRQVAPAAPSLDAELLRRRQMYPNADTEAALARDAALFTKSMPRPEPAPYNPAAQAAYEQVLNETSVAPPPPPVSPPAAAPKAAPKPAQSSWRRGEPLSDREAKAREWLATPIVVAKPSVDYKNILQDDNVTIEPVKEPVPPQRKDQRGAILGQTPQYRDLLTVPTATSTNTPSPAMTQYTR
jgi:hypothetical protein